mmetsp:Transcript_8205/g.17927  ORF Transcript_8205/g.17927 Transcript_8205/m.17927 type:complete len:99 (+) Transcript_8205:894-1190(+)
MPLGLVAGNAAVVNYSRAHSVFWLVCGAVHSRKDSGLGCLVQGGERQPQGWTVSRSRVNRDVSRGFQVPALVACQVAGGSSACQPLLRYRGWSHKTCT